MFFLQLNCKGDFVMKRLITVILTVCSLPAFAEEVPQKVNKFIPALQTCGTDFVLIETVINQNSKKPAVMI